jgi:hypothetical protein
VISLSSLFPKGRRRKAAAAERLSHAYTDVFCRQESAELVLADLAAFSGFYQVTPPGASDAEVRYAEGMRAVFARIERFRLLTPQERTQLEQAARQEAITSQKEGTI